MGDGGLNIYTLITYNSYSTRPNPRVIYAGTSRKQVNAYSRSIRKYGGMVHVVQRVAVDDNKENKNAN